MKNIFAASLACAYLFFAYSLAAFAQNAAPTNNQNSFVSAIDQDLSLKKMILIPVVDNVSGIYAKPIEEELINQINADLQWSLVKSNTGNVDLFQLEDSPQQVAQVLKSSDADGMLVARMTKGPNGINGALTLFVGRQGLPLLQENLVNFKGFDIAEVRSEYRKLYTQLRNRLPYRGIVMSRRGQQVTINLGASYGLRPNMNVTVMQIVKLNRHPKLNFMISSEKEVLGRVQLAKVEQNLSFGSIIFEREPGVVSVGTKVIPENFVKYSTPVTTPDGKILQTLSDREDKEVAFGHQPEAWLPEQAPQYGKIALLAGLANYDQNTSYTAGGSVSATNSLAPNILARGELWLNPNWFVGFNLRQSVFSVSNELSGSSPGKLSMSMGQYGVNAGYNFLMSNDFFGPKLQVSGGFTNSKFKIDDSSPTAFSSMDYSGFLLGLAGQFPLSEEVPIDLGATFNYWMSTGLTENISSGSSSNTVNSFGFFLDYRMRTRFKLKAELDFDYFNSSFSGTATRTSNPASSTSHKITTLLLGVEYLF